MHGRKIMPKGSGGLLFIQLFATLSFAALFSTLVLFTTSTYGFSATQATAIMGEFVAFNYALHLLGGYLGGRLLSFRNLFFIGMAFQIVGLMLLATLNVSSLFLGLGCFLTGSGLNITCINMMLTQLFEPHDKRREAAFLWNYSGMNVGFFMGFTLAGFFQLSLNYQPLFIIASCSNIITMLLTLIHWKKLSDKTTAIINYSKKTKWFLGSIGLLLMLGMVPLLEWLLQHAIISNDLILIAGISAMGIILFLSFKQTSEIARKKIHAYLILALSSVVFWSLFMLAPMGLTLFAKSNVDRNIFGQTIPPQWIQNINAIVIIFGGPLMVKLLHVLRERKISMHLCTQFYCALFLIGIGFIILPLGILFADPNGLVSFYWILISYIFQSFGELFISPIGYAMIGQLAPKSLQGLMMGSWMMISGIAAVIASYFSSFALRDHPSTNPLITNPSYSHVFLILGVSALACGVLLVLLKNIINSLIEDRPCRA